jgi:Protein of unknown function (DUF2474)
MAPGQRAGARLWLKRLAWMVALWVASVAALGLAAFLMRALMRAAGLK